jgi:Domain of unknown function (DUF6458)
VGLGLSLFLIALGAILRFAVTATVAGVSIQTVGVILMVVGVIGLVLSFIFWASWGGFGRRTTVVDRDETVVRDDLRRTRYDDHDDIDRAA